MYIKNKDHFMNFINMSIKRDIDLLNLESINENKDEILYNLNIIFDYKLADQYTWQLKNDIEMIYIDNILFFIENNKKSKMSFNYNDDIILESNNFTNKFKETIKKLNFPGCYLFSNSKKKYYYIGMSNNLKSRVLSSYNERFNTKKIKLFFEYYKTQTISDAHILEAYLIATHAPMLNKIMYGSGAPTIKLSNLPEISNRFLVKNNGATNG